VNKRFEFEKRMIIVRANAAQPMQCARCGTIHPWPSACWPSGIEAICWSCVYSDLQADRRDDLGDRRPPAPLVGAPPA
jgi:hypothetical protein